MIKTVQEPQAGSNQVAGAEKPADDVIAIERRHLKNTMTAWNPVVDKFSLASANGTVMAQTSDDVDATADGSVVKASVIDFINPNKNDLQATSHSANLKSSTAAAAAISQSKCHEATDSLPRDLFRTPETIRLREPKTPDLVRIASSSSFSCSGTERKMMSPAVSSSTRLKRLPTPIDLKRKLSDGNDVKRALSSLSYFYGIMASTIAPMIYAVIEMLSPVFFFISRCCHSCASVLTTSIQKNPQISVALFSSVLTFLLHIITIYGSFVWDDRAAILGNPDILGTRPILDAFKHDFWGQDMTLEMSHKSYRPLTVLSLRLTHFRAGVESASAYHLDNVLIHAIVTYMFSRVCFVLIGQYIENKKQVILSATLSSILFAVHPIHTEAVASVVGRLYYRILLFVLFSPAF